MKVIRGESGERYVRQAELDAFVAEFLAECDRRTKAALDDRAFVEKLAACRDPAVCEALIEQQLEPLQAWIREREQEVQAMLAEQH
jgi:hypothetical protein